MHLSSLMNRKRAIRALCMAVMAFPLLGASDCGTEPDDTSEYDGTYTLLTVDGQSLPYNMIYVDSRNRLVLTKGVWSLNGSSLSTAMYTTSYVNGVGTSEFRFNPERHTGTVTLSGGVATGTLDSGSSVSTTFSSGSMLTTYNGHRMYFVKTGN